MKKYSKPEVEVVDFATEDTTVMPIEEPGAVPGVGYGGTTDI